MVREVLRRGVGRPGVRAAMAVVVGLLVAACAGEGREIRSTGDTSLGTYAQQVIIPAQARLKVDYEDRRLERITAGTIGNRTYREHWAFDDRRILFNSLPEGYFYRRQWMGPEQMKLILCGPNPDETCDFRLLEKTGENLVKAAGYHRGVQRVCAAIVYIGQTGGQPTGAQDLYGNYTLQSAYCLPQGSADTDRALAWAAHFAMLVRKDGRPVAPLAGYGFTAIE
jgi:hypothetical protein